MENPKYADTILSRVLVEVNELGELPWQTFHCAQCGRLLFEASLAGRSKVLVSCRHCEVMLEFQITEMSCTYGENCLKATYIG